MSTPARRRLMRDFKRYRGRRQRGSGGARGCGARAAGRGGGRTTWRRGRARSADCVVPGRAARGGLRRLRSGVRLSSRATPNAQGRVGSGGRRAEPALLCPQAAGGSPGRGERGSLREQHHGVECCHLRVSAERRGAGAGPVGRRRNAVLCFFPPQARGNPVRGR